MGRKGYLIFLARFFSSVLASALSFRTPFAFNNLKNSLKFSSSTIFPIVVMFPDFFYGTNELNGWEATPIKHIVWLFALFVNPNGRAVGLNLRLHARFGYKFKQFSQKISDSGPFSVR